MIVAPARSVTANGVALIEGSPEILKPLTTPDRIAIGDAWSDLVFDRKRENAKLFRPAVPTITCKASDLLGTALAKPALLTDRQFNMGVRVLCDDVWFVTHQEEPGRSLFQNSQSLIWFSDQFSQP